MTAREAEPAAVGGHGERTLACTVVPGLLAVSTIDLEHRPPEAADLDQLLGLADGSRYETMVFPAGSYLHVYREGYRTRAEALEGHARISARVIVG